MPSVTSAFFDEIRAFHSIGTWRSILITSDITIITPTTFGCWLPTVIINRFIWLCHRIIPVDIRDLRSIVIPHLSGHKLKIKSEPKDIVQHSSLKAQTGSANTFGHFYVKLEIVFTETLDDEVREKTGKLLPA
eukprot:362088_1